MSCELLILQEIEEIITSNEQILQDNKVILRRLNEIEKRLERIYNKLDEEVLINAKTATRHLVDGLNTKVKKIQNDELLIAHKEFSTLISLDSELTTKGIPNKWLICIGYWGRFHYYYFRGDLKRSLIQVYECTEKYPEQALEIFSFKFFSKDYQEIGEYMVERKQREQTLSKKQADFTEYWPLISSVAEKCGWGLITLAGVSSVVFSGLNPLNVIAAKQGAEKFSHTVIENPLAEEVRKINLEINASNEKINSILLRVKNESKKKLTELDSISQDDLDSLVINIISPKIK